MRVFFPSSPNLRKRKKLAPEKVAAAVKNGLRPGSLLLLVLKKSRPRPASGQMPASIKSPSRERIERRRRKLPKIKVKEEDEKSKKKIVFYSLLLHKRVCMRRE